MFIYVAFHKHNDILRVNCIYCEVSRPIAATACSPFLVYAVAHQYLVHGGVACRVFCEIYNYALFSSPHNHNWRVCLDTGNMICAPALIWGGCFDMGRLCFANYTPSLSGILSPGLHARLGPFSVNWTVRYVLYISVTLCLCLQVVKSARPSTPQGLSYSTLLKPTGMKGVSI